VSEFTGERVIPGEVNPDLWAEHFSRYVFAARFASAKQVLDIGCGAGYGTAELAKHASATVGIDVAVDALNYARSHYPNVRFEQAPASALPFADQSFDLITAFEVIEHLNDWRQLLAEARRVMRHNGTFFVSTPNKSYYAESRSQDGPNPFHVHEFEYNEFTTALREFFPSVTIYLQNWNQSLTFTPGGFTPVADSTTALDATLESTESNPEEAHFFLAACSLEPAPQSRGLLFASRASNLLRDREHHIQSLDRELADARSERDAMIVLTATQKAELEHSNRWAQKLEIDWKATLERVAQLQDELQTAQTRATEVAHQYAQKVAELEAENREKTAWALETERRYSIDLAAKCEELAEAVRLLERAEATVVERTQWAQRTQGQLSQLEAQLNMIRDSRWIKLGRTVGLGPRIVD
jgi:SAM-dependent methyltransferase